MLSGLAVVAPSAFAHDVGEVTRAASWSWDPYYTVPLALTAALYLIGFLRMRSRLPEGRSSWSPFALFFLGWASLAIALNSPVHEIGEQLFWVHMTQHEILMLIAAPLLVLARPMVPFLWAIPRAWREALGSAAKAQPFSGVWGFLSGALTAWILHAIALWAWHAPPLFDATVHNQFIHALQHVSFLGTALLFWWALIHGHRGQLSTGAAVLYVFTTAAHTSVLGALLTFAPSAWYHSYLVTAPLWGFGVLEDQQIGGLIMWVPSGVLLTIVGLAMVVRGMRASDRRWQYSRTAAVLRGAAEVAHER